MTHLFKSLLIACSLAAAGCGNRRPLIDPPRRPGSELNSLGLRALATGDLELAEDLFRRAIADGEALDDLEEKAHGAYNLAVVLTDGGRFAEAFEHLDVAHRIYGELGHRSGTARALAAKAHLLHVRGRLEDAGRMLEEAVSIAPAEIAAEIITNLAMVRLAEGRNDAARSLAEEAVRRAGERAVLADALFNLARVYAAHGRLPAAMEALERTRELDQAAGRRRDLAATLSFLGRLCEASGSSERAEDYYRRAANVREPLADEEARKPVPAAGSHRPR